MNYSNASQSPSEAPRTTSMPNIGQGNSRGTGPRKPSIKR